ncbi:MAG: isochorismate synthase [Actinomycetota bacterium]|nr:isochorismate synthase [Actinomycetota bacterium]
MTRRAVTVDAGGQALDPLTCFRPGDVLVAGPSLALLGVGTAAELSLPGGPTPGAGPLVARALGAYDVTGDVTGPGTGPVALGALPFEPGPARLVVPRLVLGRDGDGRSWLTVVAEDGEPIDTAAELARLRARRPTAPAFGRLPARPHATAPRGESGDRFTAMVAEALGAIARTDLAKVVLSRSQVIEADPPVDLATTVHRWHALDPTATVFAVPDGGNGTVFAGASPELLVARRGSRVATRPLAGTAPRGTDPRHQAEVLRHSAKDAVEHRIVVDAVRDVLSSWCDELQVPDRPSVIETNGVSHLATTVTGSLRPGDPPPTALELAALLHPTPAVGGAPRHTALELLARLEGAPRGRYAGPVGWVDARGDGDWVIGIRAALLSEPDLPGHYRRAELTAGVGIVAGSDPQAELAETELKLDSIRRALFPIEPAGLSHAG